MTNSSNDRSDPKPSNTNNAAIWAAVVGLGTAGLVFWILDSQGIIARIIAGIASGVAVAISSYRKSAAANARSGRKSGDKSA